MVATILLISVLAYLPGQGAKSVPPAKAAVRQESDLKRSQPAKEQGPLIREAEKNHYLVRRVEFLGNVRTRDNVLRRRLNLINEGEVFTRGKLMASLANVSRLTKVIYPVRLSDVVIHLDRENREVDIEINFTEKRLPYRGQR